MTDLTQAFLAYCQSKPAGEAYNYVDNRTCAFAQFLRDTGVCAEPSVVPYRWRDRAGAYPPVYYDISDEVEDAISTSLGIGGLHTFSALNDRLLTLSDLPT